MKRRFRFLLLLLMQNLEAMRFYSRQQRARVCVSAGSANCGLCLGITFMSAVRSGREESAPGLRITCGPPNALIGISIT